MRGATPDKIAYSHEVAPSQEHAIWVMDSDGTNRHQITNPPEDSYDIYPTWSPDGSRIAFSRQGNLQTHLFVINSDGTGEQQLTFGDVSDDYPAWSPDGTRIAYDHYSSSNPSENGIWVMNPDGTGGYLIASDGFGMSNTDPTWSPDGTHIAYVHYEWDIGENIWIMDADGSNPQQLTTVVNNETPAWSPLGLRIAYMRHGDEDRIYLINLDGSNEISISDPPDWWSDSYPAWSPDGTRIAFEREFPDAEESEIWVMNADGTNPFMINEAGNDPAWWGPISGFKHRVNLPSLLPLASTNIAKGNNFLSQADDLLTQARSKNLDTSVCEKFIDEADDLLTRAKKNMTNPIYANNLALEAQKKLNQAIDCLKALLG